MLNQLPITLPLEEIRDYCRTQPIQRLSLFGSVLRDDFTDESDVDMLVEYEPDAPVGYFDMAGQEIELSALVGRKVDLRTPQELSRYFRQEVVDTAVLIYERA